MITTKEKIMTSVDISLLRNYLEKLEWRYSNTKSNNFAVYQKNIADEFFRIVVPLKKNTANYGKIIENCLETISRAYDIPVSVLAIDLVK